MKIIVLSDIHYPGRLKNLPDFTKILQSAEYVFALGDFTKMDVIDLLSVSTDNIDIVYGNMDEPVIKNYYPQKKIIRLFGKKIGIIHGWGPPWGLRKKLIPVFEEKPDIIFYGHTHVFYDGIQDNIHFINPGAFVDGDYIEVEFSLDKFEIIRKNWKKNIIK